MGKNLPRSTEHITAVVTVIFLSLAGMLGVAIFHSKGSFQVQEDNANKASEVHSAVSWKPEIEEQTGSIVLPLERFSVSEAERFYLAKARTYVMQACLLERGVKAEVRLGDSDQAEPSRRYGIWTMHQARERGYAVPHPAGRVILRGAPEHDVDACEGTEAHRVLTIRYPDVQYADFDSYAVAKNLPAGRAVIDSWRQCLLSHGVAASPQEDRTFLPQGVTMEPSASNKRIAVIDVKCKKRTELVQKLAAIEAEVQRERFEENPEAIQRMVEQRQEVDRILAYARSVIATGKTTGVTRR